MQNRIRQTRLIVLSVLLLLVALSTHSVLAGAAGGTNWATVTVPGFPLSALMELNDTPTRNIAPVPASGPPNCPTKAFSLCVGTEGGGFPVNHERIFELKVGGPAARGGMHVYDRGDIACYGIQETRL